LNAATATSNRFPSTVIVFLSSCGSLDYKKAFKARALLSKRKNKNKKQIKRDSIHPISEQRLRKLNLSSTMKRKPFILNRHCIGLERIKQMYERGWET